LSKALLIFTNPVVLSKDNLYCIKYLKAYGANCYGGKIGGYSTNAKIE
jgi:hypothetical protein